MTPPPPPPEVAVSQFRVKDTFASVEEASRQLRHHLADRHLSVKVEKADSKRFMSRCLAGRNACDFYVLVAFQKKTDKVEVRKYVDHTCHPDTHRDWSGSVALDYLVPRNLQLMELNPQAKSKDIQIAELQRGNQITANCAFVVKKVCLNLLWGDAEASFQKIPALLSRIATTDLGVFWRMKTNEGVFDRCFIASSASIAGFGYCRPLIAVDGTFWKANWNITLLLAISTDGDNHNFVMAWGIVKSESEDNWAFFMDCLKRAFGMIDNPRMSIISDRSKGLDAAIRKSIPNAQHLWCCQRLWENLNKATRPGDQVRAFFWQAADAENQERYDNL